MPVPSSDVKFEIGHVLFIDIVDYCKLLITEQQEQLQTLKEIVRATEQVRIAEAEGKLLRLPTGDGGALVFRTSPEAPVLSALEITRALKDHPELRVRIGIHSGPVSEITDLNEQANIAGAGIDVAQRVMDCGDAGHILLSKHVAEDLAPHPRWNRYLHDLGECEVKHGDKVFLVNFYTDEFGNPEPPEKLDGAQQQQPATAITRPPASTSRRNYLLAAAGILLVAAIAIGVWFYSRQATVTASLPGKAIAVLPFENLSRDPDNAYFAEGIKDQILTRLGTVRDLKVISRTSTAKYQSKPNNLKTVARELGVSTILEGAVQKAGDKVRVNVQLIDARADTHLWAKSYDRDLKDVLGVESEVSQQIADALQAKLSPSESEALASAGTHDTQAYDLFLRGEYEFNQAERILASDAYDRADASYRQALARDPNFAKAAAELARSRLSRHWFVSPLASRELEDVKSLIDHALTLAPNSPEAHFAMGLFFYWGYRQYKNALTEFNRTLELQPNNALAQQYCAWVYRRRGEWERSLADAQRAEELDPRDASIPANIGATYFALRQWKDAERAELRALAIDPHSATAAAFLVNTHLNGTGDVGAARRAFDGFPEDTKSLLNTAGLSGYGVTPGGLWGVLSMSICLNVIERRFTDAFQALEKRTSNNERLEQLFPRVILHLLTGQTDAAKSTGEEALPLLEAKLKERPDDAVAMAELSWVYLAVGRNAEALRLFRQAADLVSIEKDALGGQTFQIELAQLETRAGAPEEAIKRLRHLMSIPAGEISITRLKIDPVWNPIRDRPDFQQLLSGPEQIGPNK